jgi:hypothetical protein
VDDLIYSKGYISRISFQIERREKMLKLKRIHLSLLILLILAVAALAPVMSHSGESSSDRELAAIKKKFGSVLKLTGSAAGEINAIANLLTPGSGMMAIDRTQVSGEFCMLEPKTGKYMVHFSKTPEKTTEDILYFINPENLKKNGLQVKNLPTLPTTLGKMTPFQWYYYDGNGHEPHHGGRIGREFIVMAIDVK